MEKYDHQTIEKKWQELWEKVGLNKTDLLNAPKPYYNLMMYPYPSAEGLHVGNVYAFTGSDVHGRFMRMQGFDVFEPIGFDSGGIHSENFAIKMGVHPKKLIASNIAHFTEQLKMIGNMFDWDHTVDAMEPGYYRWTQWLFIQLFKAGLAYKKAAPVTWCPSCKTTVSDEQTEKQEDVTVCERCKTPIERRNMNQWFFKITNYAQRLLDNTYTLNWPDKVLHTQRNWIGRSMGAEIAFPVQDREEKITVFTTRPDTLYGVTFFVLAPEHPLLLKITPNNYQDSVVRYQKKALSKSEQQRKLADKDKTGVFTGAYVINPVTGESVPIWVADYVLMEYGEGAVMGVPAHDERDFEFAKKYDLAIKPVISSPDDSACYHGEGKIINSGEWNGWQYPQDIERVIAWIEEKEIGKAKTTYKLRDWNISRQRYWGPPIPMIFCPECAAQGKSWFDTQAAALQPRLAEHTWDTAGWYPVAEDQLPVLLPDIEDYLPDGSGKSPLARVPEFVVTTCPVCGGKAERETDVSDTFLDSSWYFLRYPSTAGGVIRPEVSEQYAFDPELTKKWLPVSQYSGGAEHSVLHLMYSRFITMVLHDLSLLQFEEPFPNFYAHGLIIKDGAKMSKSKGNVVNPDEYIERFGADVLRLYLSFIGPYSEGGDFRDSGIAGMERFLRRVWRFVNQTVPLGNQLVSDEIESARQKTINRATEGIKRFKYNTSIAAIMEYLNLLESQIENGILVSQADKVNSEAKTNKNSSTYTLALETLLLLMCPIAPHITEELWQRLHHRDVFTSADSINRQPWPVYDPCKVVTTVVTVVVQVNGKVRSKLEVNEEIAKDQTSVIALAKADEKVKSYLEGKRLVKEIFVPGKLVNLVVG